MKNSISKLFLSVFVLLINTVFCTTMDLKKEIARGVSLFDSACNEWSKPLFLEADDYFSTLQFANPQSFKPYYWLTVVNFYLVTYYLFGNEEDFDKKSAKEYLKKAISWAQETIHRYPQNAESYALLATLLGIKITFNPMTAVVNGPKVSQNIEKAQQIDSTNPRVYYLIGMSYYHTPGILGGGSQKGLFYLKKAEKLFKVQYTKKKSLYKPQWGYSTCLSFIGTICLNENKDQEATEYYLKALHINKFNIQAINGLSLLSQKVQLEE